MFDVLGFIGIRVCGEFQRVLFEDAFRFLDTTIAVPLSLDPLSLRDDLPQGLRWVRSDRRTGALSPFRRSRIRL